MKDLFSGLDHICKIRRFEKEGLILEKSGVSQLTSIFALIEALCLGFLIYVYLTVPYMLKYTFPLPLIILYFLISSIIQMTIRIRLHIHKDYVHVDKRILRRRKVLNITRTDSDKLEISEIELTSAKKIFLLTLLIKFDGSFPIVLHKTQNKQKAQELFIKISKLLHLQIP